MRYALGHHAVIAAALCLGAFPAQALSGTVRAQDGAPIPHAFVGLLDASWQLVAHAATDTRGAFDLGLDEPPGDGARLVVQPPGQENAEGLGAYAHCPRMYDVAGEREAAMVLPSSGNLVLHAYGADGAMLRWSDFEQRGMFGANFLYWTDEAGRMREASIWPVHDALSRAQGAPRALGLPGIMAAPGAKGVLQVLYWETQGHGKLWLHADHGGEGFTVPAAGQTGIVQLNVELARTAVAGLVGRVERLAQAGNHEFVSAADALMTRMEDAGERVKEDPVEAAALADGILADALRARDDLELAHARASITHRRGDFSFGIFQGGPYQRAPFERAREAGFDLATVLTGWAWCDLAGGATTASQVDALFGLSALGNMGYRVKSHGGVWLQEYGILPERTRGLSKEALHAGFLAQQGAMLGAFGEHIALWEAMNEPAATNEQGLSRREIHALLDASARQLKEAGQTTVVNSGVESNFGNKYQLYRLDNRPVADEVLDYLDALEQARDAGALEAVDIIGIQFYPGARNAERLGGINGPMMTLGWLVDMLDRYAAFAKPLHITEFSVPSRYEDGWSSGYWREPWTEELQAVYAEAVFTIAYAHPAVESITWWDITDAQASVITGGLLSEAGAPKPVFHRLGGLMASWGALPVLAE